MKTVSRATRPPRSLREPVLWSSGGLILVGGPPFHGKSVLAARLVDILPFARKLEVVDNLAGEEEHWYPSGVTEDPQRKPLLKMLDAATEVWARGSPPSLVIITARAESHSLRQRARRTAVSRGMKFLYVEAFSHNIRAFERLSALMLPKQELLLRMQRYEDALQQYARVSREEMQSLPAVQLTAVLSDCDAAIHAVLKKWAEI